MTTLIASLSHGVPAALTEVITLGRTLKQRAVDVLGYFDRPGTSNGPTEAINGRLEHLCGSALGFRQQSAEQDEKPYTVLNCAAAGPSYKSTSER